MKETLAKLGLDASNSIVIGSGILQVHKIRKSNDIDLVVSQKIYTMLKKSGNYSVVKKPYGDKLTNDSFDIRLNWVVLGKSYMFEDFRSESVTIDDVRYITLDFLYKAKKSWIKEKTARPKDINDLKLIEEYRKANS